MCLAIPMKIIAINGDEARASANGIERQVNLFLIKDHCITVGDFVITHVGYAIQKLDPEDARQTWQLLDSVTKDTLTEETLIEKETGAPGNA